MKRPKRILVAGIIASIATTFVIVWPREKEPVYHGKPLGQWILSYRSAQRVEDKFEAQEAVRQIGSNAFPWLLKWVGHRPPAWSRIVGVLQPSWSPANRIIISLQKHPAQIANRRWQAAFGFEILGEEASNAVPDLVRMLDSDDPSKQWPVPTWPPPAYALTRIGDSGIRALLDWVSDPQSLSRNERGVISTIRCLGEIVGNETNTDRIVSILVQGISSSNKSLAFSAALALSGMELDPSRVVETLRVAAKAGNVSSVSVFLQCLGPSRLAQPRVKQILLELQRDPNPAIQNEARAALLRIPQEALSPSPASEAKR